MPGITCMNHPAIWGGPTVIIWPCGRLRRPQKIAPGPSLPGGHFIEPGMTWLSQLGELRAFGKILWTLGVRSSYRRQFWTQLIGMLRRNPSRFIDYVVTCAMGEDLYHLRKVVRGKVGAIVKELNREGSTGAISGPRRHSVTAPPGLPPLGPQ